ncbi:MAG: general secretion pathway protein GspJ [Xanthobacteraceae bacterium]|nr:general secretion pathway protein GspJ [Xanthobacteraceae bacterium]
MTRHFHARVDAGRLGFSLIETLAALFLMGLILSALARLTSQWMPGWDRAFDRIQRSESVGIALERMSEDVGAAEFMRASHDAKSVFFDGQEDAMTFVRTARGPNVNPGLDVVRIAETRSGDEHLLIRSHARFVPGPTENLRFADPVVLLRSPFSVSFSFAGGDRALKPVWREPEALPQTVLVTMRDAATGAAIGVSRMIPVHISASAESTCNQVDQGCGDTKQQSPQPSGRDGR